MISRPVLVLCVLSFGIGASSKSLPVNDGNYKSVSVSTLEQCKALCEKDRPRCRGTQLNTSTLTSSGVTTETITCFLNDGTGDDGLFSSVAPKPLDLEAALSDLNAYRVSKGLSRVALQTQLGAAAQAHSDDLAQMDKAQHEGSDGKFHDSRVKREGYEFSQIGENVATGQLSWDEAFKSWQDSPSHNENLLMEGATEFSVALTYKPGGVFETYWTMLIGAPLPTQN